jgi:multimeric flavodoxin WrbA
MKKILIIKGSDRRDGYTNKFCKEIEDFYKDEEVIIFDTFNEKFAFCNGCNYCEKNGKCINRDLDGFFKEFESTDIIFFTSPVYNGTFSAPVKSLIDRFQVYYTSFYANGKVQKIEKRRKAYLFVCAGRDGKVCFEYMKTQLKFAFSILNIEFKDAFLCSNTDTQSNYEDVLSDIKRSLSDE